MSNAPVESTTSQREVLELWLPLALSTSILLAEAPLATALVSRGSAGSADVAAFGIAVGVLVVVDAPALALVTVAASFPVGLGTSRRLQHYALAVGGVMVAVLAVALVTGGVRTILRSGFAIGGDILDQAVLALWTLLPAPVAVGWRCVRQGQLVAAKRTRMIVWATVGRLVSTTAVAAFGVFATSLPGAACGGIALATGASVEAVLLTALTRHVFDGWISPVPPPLRSVIHVHAPLTTAMALTLVPEPLVAAAIARGQSASASLAAWPVLYGLIWVVSGPTLEVEPVAASLRRASPGEAASRRFALTVGVLLVACLLLLSWSPLASLYIQTFSGLTGLAGQLATSAVVLTVCLPILFAIRSWTRGALVAANRAAFVQHSAWFGTAALVIAAFLAVATLSMSAVAAGALALLGATAVETGLVSWYARRMARVSA